MPTTRRRRANPPDQPENTNNHADQTENTAETAETSPAEQTMEKKATPAEAGQGAQGGEGDIPPYQQAQTTYTGIPASGNEHRVESRNERPDVSAPAEPAPIVTRRPTFRRPPLSSASALNGTTHIAAPQPTPPTPPPPAVTPPPMPTPTHEISLPLGNLLHLAYNPSYTGSDEARKTLLHKLAQESKTGGRARCWSCGSLAIAYDYWNTRSKNFGEVGVAFCEICGVWSVM